MTEKAVSPYRVIDSKGKDVTNELLRRGPFGVALLAGLRVMNQLTREKEQSQ